jgi:hypothetical protein
MIEDLTDEGISVKKILFEHALGFLPKRDLRFQNSFFILL